MTHSRIKWTDDCSIELRIVQPASAAVLRLLTINGLLMVLAVTFCGSWNGSIKPWDNKREDDGGRQIISTPAGVQINSTDSTATAALLIERHKSAASGFHPRFICCSSVRRKAARVEKCELSISSMCLPMKAGGEQVVEAMQTVCRTFLAPMGAAGCQLAS